MSANESSAAVSGTAVHDAVTNATTHQPAAPGPKADTEGLNDTERGSQPEISRISASRSRPESPASPRGPVRTDTNTAIMQSQLPSSPPPMALSASSISRVTPSAIDPSADQPTLPAKDEEHGPKLQITLLLTNGARHPFRLDAKYLAKRNVTVQDDDPYNLSVYELKELILREWREEWEVKPSSPSYIRLITFGRLLDDKASLKDQRFNPDAPNVVHMTIKPQDFIDEEEGGKGAKAAYSGRRHSGERSSPGCRCTIM